MPSSTVASPCKEQRTHELSTQRSFSEPYASFHCLRRLPNARGVILCQVRPTSLATIAPQYPML
eukprot:6820139-Alexandrium_andersonii.AAC.1